MAKKNLLIKPAVSLFKTTKFKLIAALATFLMSSTIAVAMFVGVEAGNFVIQVEGGDVDKSISITTNIDDPSTYTDRLSAPSLSGLTHNTLNNITHNGKPTLLKVIENDELVKSGQIVLDKPNNQYFIYTFYIVNNSSNGVDVGVTLRYSDVKGGLDDAIRILTYNSSSDIAHVYQKQDNEIVEYKNYYYTPQYFKGDGIVVENEGDGTHPSGNASIEKPHHLGSVSMSEGIDNYIKYTVIFWLEGQDPECNNEIFNSSMRLSMDITILS